MLPKVSKEVFFSNDSANNSHLGAYHYNLRMMSASAAGVKAYHGRRAFSTKSANLTSVPLDINSMPSGGQQKGNLKPYFPYSSKTLSPTRQKQIHPQQQQTISWKWKSEGNNYKSEYAYNRIRAQSHKNVKEPETKSMPYLVPRTANSSRFVKFSDGTEVKNYNEKVLKYKPVAAALSQQRSEPQDNQLKEMVMTGTGKAPGIVNTSISFSSGKGQAIRERIQVCRTKEEKEKNPETIRLDKTGLRVFPDIGGGESVTLKLLSLQHNMITKLENVPLLSQLVVLDLYDNRVDRITGLQGLPSLRVLLLGKNRIKRIEGLESLKRLEILDLHGNQLRYVDNLGPLTSLRVLNLAGNLLRNIRNLGPYGMSSLTELNLKRNRIKNLEGLQKAPHLKRLLLANNDLQTISSLAPLRKLVFLRELVIDPNPFSVPSVGTGSTYRSQVLTLFPNLSSLDRNPITEEMKTEAKIWHKKKLAEEEAKQKEEARIRDEMAAKVGPPGSREQVIYQARRRWESLKSYVKTGSGSNSEINVIVKPTKKNLKSLKSVVKAATDKVKSAMLYPPSTLDLEKFPDGQAELEQTESLIGNKADEEACHEPIRVFATSTSASSSPEYADDGYSHFSPEPFRRSHKENELPVSLADQTVEPFGEQKDNLSGFEIHARDVENNHDVITLPLQGQTEISEQYDSNLPILSPPTSDRSRDNSARVAVVRPLVREVNLDDNHLSTGQSQTQADNNLLVATPDEEVPEAPKSSQKFNPEVEFDSPVKHSFLKTPDDIAIYSASEIDENDVCEPDNLQEELNTELGLDPAAQNTYISISLEKEKERISEAKSESPMQTSEKGRSKLLKHLRSISLDSYPHQFFQDVMKEKEELEQYSDDDDGEDDGEDNDNEVQDYDCDDLYSSAPTTATSMNTPRRNSIATTNRILKGGGSVKKSTFPRTKSQRIKLRDRAAKLLGTSPDNPPRSPSMTGKRINSGTGSRKSESNTSGRPTPSGKVLRRCDSAMSLTSTGVGTTTSSTMNAGNNSNKITAVTSLVAAVLEGESRDGTPLRKQGVDFLVEIEGKVLNVFGQGGLRHALTAFAPSATCHVATAKFHYITYDSIIPLFGKLRQVFPALEHFHFRANNIFSLAQLDALSDLQGLSSLVIIKEGNPIVSHEAWAHYASYRLSHWGLQIINGKEVCSEYRGGVTPAAQAKRFESLGFLALSCLPQSALTPLAKRLHMLHCFCCCSPSTSSDESSKPQRLLTMTSHSNHGRAHSPSQQTDHSPGNFCTAWDDDPVLLDVIGKEALVYCPPPLPLEEELGYQTSSGQTICIDEDEPLIKPNNANGNTNAIAHPPYEKKREETLGDLIHAGVEIVEKVDRLEKVWPTLLTEVIQEMLMDYRFMDTYMKKEMKKTQDVSLISNHHGNHHSQHQHSRRNRH